MSDCWKRTRCSSTSRNNSSFEDKADLEPSLILLKPNRMTEGNRGFPLMYDDHQSEGAGKNVRGLQKTMQDHKETLMADIRRAAQSQSPSKRFNEFVGKRNVLPLTPNFNYISSEQSNPSENVAWENSWDSEMLIQHKGSPANDPMAALKMLRDVPLNQFERMSINNKEMLSKFLNKFYKTVMSKNTPKRQYDFVGKRTMIENRSPEQLQNFLSKKYDFIGKKNFADLMAKRYDFIGKKSFADLMGKRYDFIGKRYDFIGKRSLADFLSKRYDFLGKRNSLDDPTSKRYDFIGKRDYDFLGKKNHFIEKIYFSDDDAKRSYDFLGKRVPSGEMKIGDTTNMENSNVSNGKTKTDNMKEEGGLNYLVKNMDEEEAQGKLAASKRYSEWLGKRKRNGMDVGHSSHNLSSQRLAALLRNNTLRKRLSRMLLHSRMPSISNTPEFIGKR